MTARSPDSNGAAPTPLPRGELSDRIPGQSVLQELLVRHEAEAPRGRLRRLFGSSPLGPDSQPWYSGSLGERSVGRSLQQLGPAWTVVHAVPVGRGTSDIDHVLIGPGGVFTLNTKRHAGQRVWAAGTAFLVGGRKQPHLRNALHEAERASKLLSTVVGRPVEVHGVIVVVDAKSVVVKERHPRVAVLEQHQLVRWLQRRRPSLDREDVEAVSSAAVQASTWHRNPVESTDPALLEQRYAALRAQVNHARRRRVGWTLAGFAATVISIAVFLPGLVAEILT